METSNIEIWNRHYLKPESKQSYPDEALVRMVRSLPAAGEYRQPSGRKAGPDSMDSRDSEDAGTLASSSAPRNSSTLSQGESGLQCLDFGCGSGRHISLLAENGYLVTGCDSSSNAIEHCRQLYPDAHFYVCKDLSVPLSQSSDGLYDLIVCWGVIHYLSLEEGKDLLETLNRALRPGGFLLGTLRKDSDTQFQSSAVSKSSIHLYDEPSLQQMIGDVFAQYEYGFMERSLLGNLQSIVAHWFFRARKDSSG